MPCSARAQSPRPPTLTDLLVPQAKLEKGKSLAAAPTAPTTPVTPAVATTGFGDASSTVGATTTDMETLRQENSLLRGKLATVAKSKELEVGGGGGSTGKEEDGGKLGLAGAAATGEGQRVRFIR